MVKANAISALRSLIVFLVNKRKFIVHNVLLVISLMEVEYVLNAVQLIIAPHVQKRKMNALFVSKEIILLYKENVKVVPLLMNVSAVKTIKSTVHNVPLRITQIQVEFVNHVHEFKAA